MKPPRAHAFRTPDSFNRFARFQTTANTLANDVVSPGNEPRVVRRQSNDPRSTAAAMVK